MMAWQRQQQSEVHARPSRCRHQEPDEFHGFASEKGEEGLTLPSQLTSSLRNLCSAVCTAQKVALRPSNSVSDSETWRERDARSSPIVAAES